MAIAKEGEGLEAITDYKILEKNGKKYIENN